MVATEAKDNDLIINTVIDRVTFETGVISYMVVDLTQLMWLSLLNRLHLKE